MHMNILVAIDRHYLDMLESLLYSIQESNPHHDFTIYIFHQDLTKEDIKQVEAMLDKRFTLTAIKISKEMIDELPAFNGRYPKEIYFRLFASRYLPKDVDRILYLDTDIIVINPLDELYTMDFAGNYFIATTHVRQAFHKFNEVRLGIKKEDPYINTGVILMNIKLIREESEFEERIDDFIKNNKKYLLLPDQDILSVLYGDKTMMVDDLKYNLGDRALNIYNMNHPQERINLDWVKENSVIIHYYGRNKPWNKNYFGKLDCFYHEIEDKLRREKNNELNAISS